MFFFKENVVRRCIPSMKYACFLFSFFSFPFPLLSGTPFASATPGNLRESRLKLEIHTSSGSIWR